MIKNCVALTIAGSDSGGGAGIQADLKTFSALGVYGASVITAITAQNLEGVTGIQAVDPDIVKKQLVAVMEGFPVRGAKTGMLFSKEIIEAVANVWRRYRSVPLVIDPVFAATSGSTLIQDDAIMTLTEKLFPLATVITPNMPEAEFLIDAEIKDLDDLQKAAERLYFMYRTPILVKGGHLEKVAADVLVDSKGLEVFEREMIPGVNNHGSGCTFAAAIVAELAKGACLKEAVEKAKEYLYRGLKAGHPLADNVNVINHFWQWK
ncbi:MAG: bifunctional hydroxymethylpyrimidine kinase/phosphomethylpyrimidine kinase [candidate division Zixibacteria bacterium RBG_16_53_22]|nr:MAG: bifunctional hydroxymethylpyrimidine kinase/phosphomethylpyrimidine kinase [candidate division Zixibacteria bacterium RBG_16_53_22]